MKGKDMMFFRRALDAWDSPDFEPALKQDIAQLDASQLPLQQGLSVGSHVTDGPLGATIIRVCADENVIHVKAGIFYASIIAGCSCADDPTPLSENAEYCEVWFGIDRKTAEASVALVVEEHTDG